ncbi:hypothetical protein GGF31_002078 [Allomyces arbusculus]|nr:hypothetical protein GGF31_002078 [Allomyces arbusculus]
MPASFVHLHHANVPFLHPTLLADLQRRPALKELTVRALLLDTDEEYLPTLDLEYTPDNVVWRALARAWLVPRVADHIVVHVVCADSPDAAARDVCCMVFRLAGLDTSAEGIREIDDDKAGDTDAAKQFRYEQGGYGDGVDREGEEYSPWKDRRKIACRHQKQVCPLVVDVDVVAASVANAALVADRIRAQLAEMGKAHVAVGRVRVTADL